MAHQVLIAAFRLTHRRHAMAATRTFSVQTPSTVALTVTSVPLLATAVTGMATANHRSYDKKPSVSGKKHTSKSYGWRTRLISLWNDASVSDDSDLELPPK
ncbi:hypothetical protein Tco_0733853 [Tanacetum coccineum]